MNSNNNGSNNGQTTEAAPNVANPSRLATLVGFEEERISVEPLSVEPVPSTASLPPDSTPELAEEFAPINRNNTPRLAWSRPSNKAFLVLGIASVAAFMGYQLLSSLTRTPLKQAQKPPATLEEFPLLDDSKTDETGKYKTETALGDQAQAINKLNEKNRKSFSNPKPQPARQVRPIQRSKEVAERSPMPRQVISRSPMRSTQEVPNFSRSLRSPSQPLRRNPIVPPVSIPRAMPVRTEQVKTDPMQEWLLASQLGSYGYSPTKESKANDAIAQGEEADSEEVLAVNAENSSPANNQPEVINADYREAETRDTKPATTSRYQAEEHPILQETPRQFIRAGVKAKATLTTPFAWDETEKTANQDRFIVVLAEPLIAADGEVALPAQAQLVTQMRSFSKSGMVRLAVVAAIVEENGEFVEINLPNDTIQVRGVEGKALIAKTLNSKRSQTFGRDTKQFLFGAVQKGAEVLNRPRSQSTFGSNNAFASSTDNGDPNLLAGILEGGSETLLDNLEERNKRAIEAIESSPNVMFLAAGSTVEVFVNETTAFELASSGGVIESDSSESEELTEILKTDDAEVEESTEVLESEAQEDTPITFNLPFQQVPSVAQFYLNSNRDFTKLEEE